MLGVLLGALLFASCAVRLIADYDQPTFDRTAELQEECERLFVALEEAAATPDPTDDLYPAHAEAYAHLVASVRVLETRAQTLDRNEIPAEQVGLLRDSLERMRDEHRARSQAAEPEGFSAQALSVLREPVVQQFRAILTLQEGLKR